MPSPRMSVLADSSTTVPLYRTCATSHQGRPEVLGLGLRVEGLGSGFEG